MVTHDNLPQCVGEMRNEIAELKAELKNFTSQYGKATTMPEKKYLSMNEAMEFLGLTKPSLYGYIHRRAIPHVKTNGKIMFAITELEKWLSSGNRPTVSEIGNNAVSIAAEAMQKGGC